MNRTDTLPHFFCPGGVFTITHFELKTSIRETPTNKGLSNINNPFYKPSWYLEGKYKLYYTSGFRRNFVYVRDYSCENPAGTINKFTTIHGALQESDMAPTTQLIKAAQETTAAFTQFYSSLK